MPTMPPTSAPAPAPKAAPVPVPMLLLEPMAAPPRPPTTAPVPRPETVLEGATPDEQPVRPINAEAMPKVMAFLNEMERWTVIENCIEAKRMDRPTIRLALLKHCSFFSANEDATLPALPD